MPTQLTIYTYRDAWEEAPTRICVAFQLDIWSQPEFDFFGSWAEAYVAHPALALVGGDHA